MTKPIPAGLFGTLLIWYGLLHLAVGAGLTEPGIWTILFWLGSTVGSIAAGLGLMRVPPFSRSVRGIALLAGLTSLLLVTVVWRSRWSIPLGLSDAALLALFLPPRAEWLNRPDEARYGMLLVGHHRRRSLAVVGVAVLVYVSVFILARV